MIRLSPIIAKLDMVFRPRNERDAKHGPCYRVVCDESEVEE